MLNWVCLKKIQYCYGWWCCCCPPMNAACVKFLMYLPRFIVSCIRSFSWRTKSRWKRNKRENIEFNWFVFEWSFLYGWKIETCLLLSCMPFTTKTKFLFLVSFVVIFQIARAFEFAFYWTYFYFKKNKSRCKERKRTPEGTQFFSIVSVIDMWN